MSAKQNPFDAFVASLTPEQRALLATSLAGDAPAKVTPVVTGDLLPGRWAKVTPKEKAAYRRRVPARIKGAKVGDKVFGIATDKAGAKAHHYVIAETKAGELYYAWDKDANA